MAMGIEPPTIPGRPWLRRPSSWERIALLTIVLLFLYQALSYWALIGPAVIDDAFISLRYARELAAGNGLVFNPGDPVEGYTSFLWTLGLGAISVFGADPLPTAQALGVACGLVTIWASV